MHSIRNGNPIFFFLLFLARIAANYNPPYITKVSENCDGPHCFAGMYPDVWHALMALMNFTYDLSPPPDKAWGTRLDDGTWNGMIGQLHYMCI